ncbi:helix-turn-helix domain-containing protein [Halocatena halophila]|uniref:helix-turn-helix domain-containing protein n=1 Tax=Halocatena halophila TaxID=2814576 RepID=UPI002ED1F01F
MDDALFVALEAPTETRQDVLRYFDATPLSYDVLHTDEQSIVIQYAMGTIPPPVRAILASGTLLQFPVSLRDGWLTFALTSSHDRLSRLKAEFEKAGFTYEVISVTQSTQPTDLVTDRQREFMLAALKHGYYDTPRECSLTELAAELAVGKSTASRVLHSAEETIIKEFFAQPIE